MNHVVKGCNEDKKCKITLNNNYPFNQYISDGKTKNYLFNFLLLNPNDLAVYATSPDVQASFCDKLVLDTDYIITNYGIDGGNIELSKAYASGYIITLTLDSNYNVDTNFKEGRTFSGAELDLVFKQISLYFKELALLSSTALKFPINSIIDPISTYIPQLKDDYIWVGQNNQVIQVPIPKGGGGGSDCCEILKAELANNMDGVDGARMIGIYNKIDNIHTNLSVAVNDLYKKINNTTTIPKPTPDEIYLPLTTDVNGNVFWDKSIVGSIHAYLHKVYEQDCPDLIYLDGDGYYPFTKSEAGIPYSRLAETWWDEANGVYEFGGSGEAYAAEVFPDFGQYVILLVNDIRIKNNIVVENVDLARANDYAPSTMSCAQLINRSALEVYERDVSSGVFSDHGTGVKFYGHQYLENSKGNSGILDYNDMNKLVGGEYFTFLGVRVYYIVNGKGNVPPSTGVRRMVKVSMPEGCTKNTILFLTKHALMGTGVYALDPDFRENAMFSLTSPDLKVYLNYGDKPNEYDLGIITLYIPEDKSMEERALLIKKGINAYSFAVPDARDLHLRCGDDEHLDPTVGWRNVEARKKFQLQYGGVVVSDTLKPHKHVYGLTSTLAQGPEIGYLFPSQGAIQIYQVNQSTTPTGNVENRGSAMIAYFYVKC